MQDKIARYQGISNALLALGILLLVIALIMFFRFRMMHILDRITGKAEKREREKFNKKSKEKTPVIEEEYDDGFDLEDKKEKVKPGDEETGLLEGEPDGDTGLLKKQYDKDTGMFIENEGDSMKISVDPERKKSLAEKREAEEKEREKLAREKRVSFEKDKEVQWNKPAGEAAGVAEDEGTDLLKENKQQEQAKAKKDNKTFRVVKEIVITKGEER